MFTFHLHILGMSSMSLSFRLLFCRNHWSKFKRHFDILTLGHVKRHKLFFMSRDRNGFYSFCGAFFFFFFVTSSLSITCLPIFPNSYHYTSKLSHTLNKRLVSTVIVLSGKQFSSSHPRNYPSCIVLRFLQPCMQ